MKRGRGAKEIGRGACEIVFQGLCRFDCSVRVADWDLGVSSCRTSGRNTNPDLLEQSETLISAGWVGERNRGRINVTAAANKTPMCSFQRRQEKQEKEAIRTIYGAACRVAMIDAIIAICRFLR